ncbi:MAG: hypothetical protein IPJ33_06900 [Gammaproteobacteria bacterium]|nr:hypothetical protein [Gammaproteobacteria bacterium]
MSHTACNALSDNAGCRSYQPLVVVAAMQEVHEILDLGQTLWVVGCATSIRTCLSRVFAAVTSQAGFEIEASMVRSKALPDRVSATHRSPAAAVTSGGPFVTGSRTGSRFQSQNLIGGHG